MKYLSFLFFFLPALLCAVTAEQVNTIISCDSTEKSPFNYDLGLKCIPSSQNNADVFVCFHGFGGDNSLGGILRTYPAISDHIVSFNFPDYGIDSRNYDPLQTSFGSIQEILPALYVLKKLVVEGHVELINLYGFSAGGGALINTLAVLNNVCHDQDLKLIGLNQEGKDKILSAIQRGVVILDCPLKSIDEIMDCKGYSSDFAILAKRYRDNHFRPIDAIQKIKNLKLNIILHFQVPDEAVANRDDALFAKKLQQGNPGITKVVIGHDGGHNSFHPSLWKAYAYFKQKR